MSYDSLRKTKATYWAPLTANGFGGTSFAAPEVLSVRWQDIRERHTAEDGKEFTSNAVVYAGKELSRNGWLLRGESTALTPPGEAYKIEMISRSQNPSGRIVVNKAVL